MSRHGVREEWVKSIWAEGIIRAEREDDVNEEVKLV